jgi:hypothetical protein
VKKAVTKDHTLFDSNFMKCPELANSDGNRLGIAWDWGIRRMTLKGLEFFLR